MTCAPKRVGPGGPKAFDMDASRPPACLFWNLGEKNCDGVNVQIKPTLFRKWEQLLTHLAQKCGCGQGVRALFTPSGHQLKEFSELKDGIDVVVVPSGYKFDKHRLPVKLAAKIGVPTTA
ncbi:ubiquitin-like protein [Histomonas meleagridis]|uniref:ubiquitin-like protein n=1 Tax=Histomonas meleagridis TaxID=135588 RepID=UPI00355A4700|nr:ubiquitin-like protein [Histomonas meleagridis]KAH0798400.1 ubiquitin-like protein [Histomonas meleagridis]